MTRFRIAVMVVAVSVLAVSALGGGRSPGKYCGVVVFDRWDGCTLYSGIYVMYVSDGAKAELREHAGKSVQIDASEVSQRVNPGDGLISKFAYLGAAPPGRSWVALDGLELRVTPAFANGERPSLKISVRNVGDKDVKVRARELAPTLLAEKGEGPWFVISPASEGPSFALITRQAFSIGPGEARTEGRGTIDRRSYAWRLDAAVPDQFILKPGGEHAATIRLDLPRGEYDFLAGYGGGVHAERGIASNLVAFDVGDDGRATLVEVERR